MTCPLGIILCTIPASPIVNMAADIARLTDIQSSERVNFRGIEMFSEYTSPFLSQDDFSPISFYFQGMFLHEQRILSDCPPELNLTIVLCLSLSATLRKVHFLYRPFSPGLKRAFHQVSVLMQRLSYPTETVLSSKITRNRIVLSFKDSRRKPVRRWLRVYVHLGNVKSVVS